MFGNIELVSKVPGDPGASAVVFDTLELKLWLADGPIGMAVVFDSPKPEAMRSPKLLPAAKPAIAKQRRPKQSFRTGCILEDLDPPADLGVCLRLVRRREER